jgi:hypothetical protein
MQCSKGGEESFEGRNQAREEKLRDDEFGKGRCCTMEARNSARGDILWRGEEFSRGRN